ncbi:pepsin-like aspartic protease [Aspergillus homomorphus CBS 101889]|uniref:Probable aspartic-type endopeptidase OPSB n=1 Tax=Aspergillus homomorphus (strain CBS 101889) TaxID=1450537 RepID=A0A395HS90_ASPHC|nr:putative yapsin [Aspergillus homomorphus CBS 101889]RAL10205.1 putative yapsin [Aspergillus homomorphus CBS 101889]
MRGAYLFPILGLSAVPYVDALQLHRRDVPATVEIPFERKQAVQPLRKRDNTVDVTLDNQDYFYYSINLTIGTPPQKMVLAIDTGSSDTWVNIASSDECSAQGDPCKPYGLFDSSASSTYKKLDTVMNSTYGGGDNAYGHYATDKVTVGGTTIKDMQFAVAEKSTVIHGLAGIGYPSLTYQATHADKTYSNLPQALVDTGAIKSPAYSLWLDDLQANTGSVLFGGVNKAKYHGELQTLPIVPYLGQYMSLAIALTEVSVEKSSSPSKYTTDLPVSCTLDSGSALILLPEDLVNKIYKELDAAYDSETQVPYISCDAAEKDYNVTFGFSGATITVPISELVLPLAEPDFDKGDCIFGIGPGKAGMNLLGDTFLRSAYVVYDMANNEISLANTNFSPGKDDILEIGTGTNAVPGATLVPSAVSSATGNGVEPTGAAPAVTVMVSGSTTITMGGSQATATETTAAAKSTSSEAGAAKPTGNAGRLLSGLAGVGMLLAL